MIVIVGAGSIGGYLAYSRLEVPANALGRSFGTLFEDSDVTVGLVEDFTSIVWRKLIANVTASPITALTHRRIDVMVEPSVRALATAPAEECIAVANAAGAEIAVKRHPVLRVKATPTLTKCRGSRGRRLEVARRAAVGLRPRCPLIPGPPWPARGRAAGSCAP